MSHIENNPLGAKPVDPDAWKHQPLFPLIRDGSRDDFKDREPLESNPLNYVVKIVPQSDPNHFRDSYISNAIIMSGIVDLRLNNEGKYTIWLGETHLKLMYEAGITDNQRINQYLISMKTKADIGRNIHIIRETVGQSCNRTPEQIKKILDAVDVALRNTFKF
ncbi:hypothetical protein HYW72_00045 [Candidatus Nomurabacteria bacterium]|nr:hypothetical protein [Candidatus Nomurabacteria bacterium]